jgi:hypothetical protein
MGPIAIKVTCIFHCKALQTLPKLGVFGSKICHLATLVPKLSSECRFSQQQRSLRT